MKRKTVVMIIMFVGAIMSAQSPSKSIPVSIGYFSFAGYQPGVKIGSHFNLKNWETKTENRKGELAKSKSFFVSPQVAFYSRINVHSSYLLNADFGYKRIKNQKRSYFAVSVGLGYLNQSQITEWGVRLNDGSKEKIRENWGWFLPSASYEFGRALNERVGWYSKFSYAYKMSSKRGNIALVFIELGMKFNLF